MAVETDPDSPTSTLVVMRHAKAESHAVTDHARPLSPRGIAQARAAGEWLAEQGLSDVHALVSSAVRTRETWRELARSIEADVQYLDGLYDAGPGEILQTLRLLDDDVTTVMVVGHNPTMQALVVELSDRSPDGERDDTAVHGFSAASVAILTHRDRWSDLDWGHCRTRAVHSP
ncbi:MAG: SixA phosphatase family protein [Nocardioidaceae bacterium]